MPPRATASAGQARPNVRVRLRVAYRWIVFALLLAIAVILRPFLALFRLFGIPRWWPAAVWFRIYLKSLNIRVVEHGRPAARPVLFATNHISWLDIVSLGTRIGGGFVSKSEVADWPLLGWFATGTGTVYLARGANQSRAANDALLARFRDGYSMAIFPEGTTTACRLPKLFHSRLFAAAIESGTHVQPVAIHYPPPPGDHVHEQHPVAPFINAIPFVPHLRGVLASPGMTVELTYCEPIDSRGLDRRQLATLSRDAICAALGSPGHEGETAVQPGRERRVRAAVK